MRGSLPATSTASSRRGPRIRSCTSWRARAAYSHPGHPFDDGHRRRGRDDAREPEPGHAEQGPVLRFGALAPAGQDQHVEVGEEDSLVELGLLHTLRHDALDEEQRTIRAHRPATVREDRHAALVVPVVDDPLEEIDIPAWRDRLEEAPGHQRYAARDAGLLDARPRAFDDRRY